MNCQDSRALTICKVSYILTIDCTNNLSTICGPLNTNATYVVTQHLLGGIGKGGEAWFMANLSLRSVPIRAKICSIFASSCTLVFCRLHWLLSG